MRDVIAAWCILSGLATLAWCTYRELASRQEERDRLRHAERLEHCRRGDHRTTIDAEQATVNERCVDCGLSEVYAHAFLTGTNRRTRRAS